METELELIGKKFNRKISEMRDKQKTEDIFYYFKSILGYYVWFNTINECDDFQNKNLNFLSFQEPPEYIFTTNYTNSVITLKQHWEKNYKRLLVPKIQVKNIHGYFNFKEKNGKVFSNLEINLNEKNNWKYFKIFYDNYNLDMLDVEIFGLNMNNDENILLSLIKIASKKEVEIDYFYKTQDDIISFFKALKRILNKDYVYNNDKQVFKITKINYAVSNINEYMTKNNFRNIEDITNIYEFNNKTILLNINSASLYKVKNSYVILFTTK